MRLTVPSEARRRSEPSCISVNNPAQSMVISEAVSPVREPDRNKSRRKRAVVKTPVRPEWRKNRADTAHGESRAHADKHQDHIGIGIEGAKGRPKKLPIDTHYSFARSRSAGSDAPAGRFNGDIVGPVSPSNPPGRNGRWPAARPETPPPSACSAGRLRRG